MIETTKVMKIMNGGGELLRVFIDGEGDLRFEPEARPAFYLDPRHLEELIEGLQELREGTPTNDPKDDKTLKSMYTNLCGHEQEIGHLKASLSNTVESLGAAFEEINDHSVFFDRILTRLHKLEQG